jgi:hypothetical protein
MSLRLIEPVATPIEAATRLLRHWPDQSHVPWLLSAAADLKDLDLACAIDETDHVARIASCLVNKIQHGDTAVTALYRFLQVALGHYDDAEHAALREFVSTARRHGIDFMSLLSKPPWGLHLRDIVQDLIYLGAIDPVALVSRSGLTDLAALPGSYAKSWPSDSALNAVKHDPSHLHFWLLIGDEGALGLSVAKSIIEQAADVDVVGLVRGVVRALGDWPRLANMRHQPTTYVAMGKEFQDSAKGLLAHLLDRESHTPHLAKEPRFGECVCRLAWMGFQERDSEMPDAMRQRVVVVAREELGRLRGELARGTDVTSAPAFFETHIDHIEAASRMLFTQDSLWSGMKPLLLLVRAAPIPVFADDLSWWHAAAPPIANNAVGGLAQALMFHFQAFVRREQADDEDLIGLRSALAQFCLERCKMNKRGDGPNEPNPIWRACALRAAAELGVNPEGKGHRIAHNMKSDAEAGVRDAATKAYPPLREGRPLPQGVSPRRAILHALWWLRQAQLQALDIKVDPEGARRTRAEEVRITTKGVVDDDP